MNSAMASTDATMTFTMASTNETMNFTITPTNATMNFPMALTNETVNWAPLFKVNAMLKVMCYVWLTPLLLLGSFSNVATILVMGRIKERNNPSSPQLMLQALAVADLLLLWSGGLEMWLFYCADIVVRYVHTAACKLCMWLVYSVSTTAAWMVTAVTIQRAIAVHFPHRVRALCTPRRTRIAIAVIIAAPLFVQLHWLVGMGVVQGVCVVNITELKYFLAEIWNWADMVLTSLTPSLFQFVCDVLLSLALLQGPAALDATPASSRPIAKRKTALRTTVMVLVLSCTFLVLTLPVCVVTVWYGLRWEYLHSDPDAYATWALARGVTSLLWYTNSAVNFLLYCATGGRFRSGFVSLVRSAWTRMKTQP